MDKGPKPLDHEAAEVKDYEKFPTKEIAETFLADEDSVNLSEFTAIKDDVVRPISV